jgi:polyhydroxyalkanoate synthesis repressor PhaR
MAYVIKRYSNRKLYDTQESRYVTLEEIEEMIRDGKEISVLDATTGDDLTSVTLAQIILENERNRRAALPSGFLHQLIKHGEAWQDFLAKSMRASLEGVVSSSAAAGAASGGRAAGSACRSPRRGRCAPATAEAARGTPREASGRLTGEPRWGGGRLDGGRHARAHVLEPHRGGWRRARAAVQAVR